MNCEASGARLAGSGTQCTSREGRGWAKGCRAQESEERVAIPEAHMARIGATRAG